MKSPYLFFCILSLLATSSVAQTIYPGGVPNCIARWDFTSTGSFSSLPDVSGNSNPGATFNMSGTTGFRGANNTAGNFNSTTTYATVPHKSMLAPSQVTIVALVKPTTYNSAGCQYNTILIKGTDYNVAGCYGMSIFDNDNDCAALGTAQTVDYIGSTANPAFVGPNMIPNNWYFLAITSDGSFIKRYCIQMDANNYNTSVSPASITPVSNPIGTNSTDIRIGQNQNSAPNYISPFTGDMDELALFNKALSDQELQAVYNHLWGGVTIDQPFTDTFLCPNATFNLHYTVFNTSAFNPGNTFTAELSDASGSFAMPSPIGSLTSNISGTIPCTMPPVPLGGNKYRIRITANGPNYISPDNGKDITIGHGTVMATITANPGTTVANNIPVTFTADAPVKGTSITYTWKKNSTPISGATSATYMGTSNVDFKHNDTISVFIKVNDVNCVYTDSAESNKFVMSVGVGVDKVANINNLTAYPNPNSGSFNITGETKNNESLQIEVLNSVGQVVYHDNWQPVNNKLDKNISLDAPAGIYILRARSENGISNTRFTIRK